MDTKELIERLASYRSRDEWGTPVQHTICDEAATALRLLTEEVEKLREHTRKQAEDIMTLGQLVYADADTTWKDRAASLRQKLEVAREALGPFVAEFTTRRDAYARRYKDRDLGYANFDKMPDRWPMEVRPFNMGVFRRSQTALTTLESPDA